jgi:hypothetical protein
MVISSGREDWAGGRPAKPGWAKEIVSNPE